MAARVALICPTIGQTRRGYERYFSDLFRFVREDIDITLFKGAGREFPTERVVPHLSRTGILSRICGDRLRYPRFQLEFASFAAAMVPALRSGGFDLIHFIDPPLGRHLSRIRKLLRKPVKLLFSNAGPLSFDASNWVDHIHCLTPSAFEEACAMGIPSERLSFVPMGVDPALPRAQHLRTAARNRHGIRPEEFVVVAVASINRPHKRIDYLIEEVAALNDNTILWLDGSLHPDGDPSLIDLGQRLLGNRFRHSHVRSEDVHDVMALADIFVSAATYESFGMAICEAMALEVPVVVHDSPHFRWLVQEQGTLVDMTVPGNLTHALRCLRTRRDELASTTNRPAVYDRFGWPGVAHAHIEMYRNALGLKGPAAWV